MTSIFRFAIFLAVVSKYGTLGDYPIGYALECGDYDERFLDTGGLDGRSVGSHEYETSGVEDYGQPIDEEADFQYGEEMEANFDTGGAGPKSAMTEEKPPGAESDETGIEFNSESLVISKSILDALEETNEAPPEAPQKVPDNSTNAPDLSEGSTTEQPTYDAFDIAITSQKLDMTTTEASRFSNDSATKAIPLSIAEDEGSTPTDDDVTMISSFNRIGVESQGVSEATTEVHTITTDPTNRISVFRIAQNEALTPSNDDVTITSSFTTIADKSQGLGEATTEVHITTDPTNQTSMFRIAQYEELTPSHDDVTITSPTSGSTLTTFTPIFEENGVTPKQLYTTESPYQVERMADVEMYETNPTKSAVDLTYQPSMPQTSEPSKPASPTTTTAGISQQKGSTSDQNLRLADDNSTMPQTTSFGAPVTTTAEILKPRGVLGIEDEPHGATISKALNSRSVQDRRMNPCLQNPNPCGADGECHWTGYAFECLPNVPYVGIQGQSCRSQCLNGGRCREEAYGYRCECLTGFSGQHCEVFNACVPNPCGGNCECVESCSHEMGYYCRSDGGFVGKNCTTRSPRITCGQTGIAVDIPRRFLEDLDRNIGNVFAYVSPTPEYGRRRSSTCQAHDNGQDLQIFLPLGADPCGAVRKRSFNGELITNRIWADRHNSEYSMPVPIADFECRYRKSFNLVSELTPIVKTTTVLQREGRVKPEIQLCKVHSCPQACPANLVVSKGAVYTVGEMIYLVVSGGSLSSAFGYAVSVWRLLMSCHQDPQASGRSILLENGCQTARDAYLQSTAGTRACVSFQAMRSLSCSTVYLHVHVKMCEASRLQFCSGSSGLRKCPTTNRRKRGVSKNEEYVVSIGPLLMLRRSEGKETVHLFPKSGTLTPTEPPLQPDGYGELTDNGVRRVTPDSSFWSVVAVATISVFVLASALIIACSRGLLRRGSWLRSGLATVPV